MAAAKTILLVDDDAEFSGAVRDVLEGAGYTIYMACDGATALEMLPQRPVDLILADVAMPHVNGYQLLTTLQQDAMLSRIPFVFISGRNLDSDIRYGKLLGVDDYLVKPLVVDDLLAVVQGKLRMATARAVQPVEIPPPAESERQPVRNTLHIDEARHRVRYQGVSVKLSAREFRLLVEMLQADGAVLTPEDLVWATHRIKTDSAEAGVLLRPLIRTLRRKLGFPPGEMGFIENVRGVGYRLQLNGSAIEYNPANNEGKRKTGDDVLPPL